MFFVATDTYSGGGSDTQVVIANTTATAWSYCDAASGDYSLTHSVTASQSTAETGAASNTYSLSAAMASTASSVEYGDSATGNYSLSSGSTDSSTTTRTGTDSAGNAFAITQSAANSGGVYTTGNHLIGNFTATAIGSGSLTTDQTVTGTGLSDTLHQVDSGSSTLTNTGNELAGWFNSTDHQYNTTTLTQGGYNTSGTFSLTESKSDNPTISQSGNGIDGIQTISQSGSESYSLSQTQDSGVAGYTLTGTGTNPYTVTGTDNANTGDSQRTQTGSDDAYTLSQTGFTAEGAYSLTLTGTDAYTISSEENSQSGDFTQGTTGSGTYTRTGSGAVSGSHSFASQEIADTRDGSLVLTNTGQSRYDLLESFNNTSDGGNGSGGIVDYSPVGLPVMVGRASVPAGVFSSVGDARHEYCFAAETRVLMADGTTKLIPEVKRDDWVLAVTDTDPEGLPRRCRVIEVYHNAPAMLLHIYVAGETIRATANHPFYVQGKGWVHAGALKPGDQLSTQSGSWVAVEGIEDSRQSEPVFNLQIEDAHTYFVAMSEDGPAVLVHNTSEEIHWQFPVDFDDVHGELQMDSKACLRWIQQVQARKDFHYNRIAGLYGSQTTNMQADKESFEYYSRQLERWRGQYQKALKNDIVTSSYDPGNVKNGAALNRTVGAFRMISAAAFMAADVPFAWTPWGMAAGLYLADMGGAAYRQMISGKDEEETLLHHVAAASATATGASPGEANTQANQVEVLVGLIFLLRGAIKGLESIFAANSLEPALARGATGDGSLTVSAKEGLEGATTAEKGVLAEQAAARTLTRAGYTELPARLARSNGFDGVWIKRAADGSIQDIIVSESKFSSTGRATLPQTENMGKQLSPEWVSKNIVKMRRSADPQVRSTGQLLAANRSVIRTKANVLSPDMINRWNAAR